MESGPIAEWLAQFLKRRGLEKPDSRHLFAYLTSNEELSELRELLGEAFASGTACLMLNAPTRRAFCLWAAEWWRAEHTGGPWKWEGLLSDIGAPSLAPGEPNYNRLQWAVEYGLNWWGLELLRTGRGRAFLVTLACEGGLPLGMVLKEEARLRQFFRVLLEELRLPGNDFVPRESLAERVSRYLPTSLRQEVVFQLAGRLASEIWVLQELLQESEEDAEDPVSSLDRIRPQWRATLPLRLDDAVAHALLRNLLSDAKTLARRDSSRIRWTRTLRRDGDEWHLEGQPEIPRIMDGEVLDGLFPGKPGQHRQLLLAFRAEDGLQVEVALCTRRSRAGDSGPEFSLEPRVGARRHLKGPAAMSEWHMVLRGPGLVAQSPSPVQGAGPLSDELPWIFTSDPSEADPERLRFRGEGSIKLREDNAHIALPPGTALNEVGEDHGEPLGCINGTERSVYRLKKSTSLTLCDGTTLDVTLGEEDVDRDAEYLLRGVPVGLSSGDHSLLSRPTVFRREEGAAAREIPASELEWRCDRGGNGWVPYNANICFGDGRLRYRDGGRVRMSRRLSLLPPGAFVQAIPGSLEREGRIVWEGVPASDVGVATVEGPGGIECVQGATRHGDLEMRLSAPEATESVEVRIDWLSGPRLRTKLPYPARAFVFRGRRGQILSSNARLALNQLSGIVATAITPEAGAKPLLLADYVGSDRPSDGNRGWRFARRMRLRTGSNGIYELDLGLSELEEWAIHRFDASTDPHCHLRVQIFEVASRFQGDSIVVGRYDLTVGVDDILGVATIPELAGREEVGDEGAPSRILEVVAFGLGGEHIEEYVLEPAARGQWHLPKDEPAGGGQFIVTAREGYLYRARPESWQVRERPEAERELEGLIARLAEDPVSEDWARVGSLLPLMEHLHPSHIPLLRAITASPRALAMAALVLPELRTERDWMLAEGLGFLWRAVPIEEWEWAVNVGAHAVREGLLSLDVLSGAIREVSDRVPGLGYPLHRAWSRSQDQPLPHDLHPLLRHDFGDACVAQIQRGRLARRSLVEGDLSWCPYPVEALHVVEELRGHPQLRGISSRLLDQRWPVDDRKFFVTNAPILLAFCATTGTWLFGQQTLGFRAIRAQDPDWFDNTYKVALAFTCGLLWRRELDAAEPE